MEHYDTFTMIQSLVHYLCTSIGTYFIFNKCGLKRRWYAFIPFFREYQIAVCADRKEEGRIYMLIQGIASVLAFATQFLDTTNVIAAVIVLLTTIILIPSFIYSYRINDALCRRFGRSPLWKWPIMIFSPTYLLWGLSSKFQPLPLEKVEETAGLSGITTKGDGKNLSINITERTAHVKLNKITLLRDIHLNIEPGHMVLLLGGSGAGKTTFLNAVTGYEKAKAKIQLGDGNVYRNYRRLKYDIGFVPQGDLIRGNDTVYRTLQDTAKLRLPTNFGMKQMRDRIDEVLDFFGIGMLKNTLVEKLSGGQRKRLSIAMEYISNPKLFILDEPDSGLDGIVTRKLFEKLREIADQGKIVIVITHTPDRVADLFDDVIVLAKDADRTGRLAFYGPVDEAYEFFGKTKMEDILRSVNQVEEGGEGRANELIDSYSKRVASKMGGAA